MRGHWGKRLATRGGRVDVEPAGSSREVPVVREKEVTTVRMALAVAGSLLILFGTASSAFGGGQSRRSRSRPAASKSTKQKRSVRTTSARSRVSTRSRATTSVGRATGSRVSSRSRASTPDRSITGSRARTSARTYSAPAQKRRNHQSELHGEDRFHPFPQQLEQQNLDLQPQKSCRFLEDISIALQIHEVPESKRQPLHRWEQFEDAPELADFRQLIIARTLAANRLNHPQPGCDSLSESLVSQGLSLDRHCRQQDISVAEQDGRDRTVFSPGQIGGPHCPHAWNRRSIAHEFRHNPFSWSRRTVTAEQRHYPHPAGRYGRQRLESLGEQR